MINHFYQVVCDQCGDITRVRNSLGHAINDAKRSGWDVQARTHLCFYCKDGKREKSSSAEIPSAPTDASITPSGMRWTGD